MGKTKKIVVGCSLIAGCNRVDRNMGRTFLNGLPQFASETFCNTWFIPDPSIRDAGLNDWIW